MPYTPPPDEWDDLLWGAVAFVATALTALAVYFGLR